MTYILGVGGNRKDWEDVEVTAVENHPEIVEVYKELYPEDELILGDAHQYLLDHYKEFDFIWCSPPCPTHSKMMKFTRHDVVQYSDMKLYQEILLLKHFFKGKWVVENVVPYYEPLIPAKKVGRHLFWSNFPINNIEIPTLKDFTRAPKNEVMDYLDIHFEKNIYYDGNHDPAQILRNCVHPKLGNHILNCARNIITKQNTSQMDIFDGN